MSIGNYKSVLFKTRMIFWRGRMSKPMRGNSYESITKSAYKAYAASTGSKTEWEELPQPIQTAWEAATRQIIDIWNGSAIEWETFPHEQKWEGWVPPRLRKKDQNANSTGKGNE
jgi:hypothetical protein